MCCFLIRGFSLFKTISCPKQILKNPSLLEQKGLKEPDTWFKFLPFEKQIQYIKANPEYLKHANRTVKHVIIREDSKILRTLFFEEQCELLIFRSLPEQISFVKRNPAVFFELAHPFVQDKIIRENPSLLQRLSLEEQKKLLKFKPFEKQLYFTELSPETLLPHVHFNVQLLIISENPQLLLELSPKQQRELFRILSSEKQRSFINSNPEFPYMFLYARDPSSLFDCLEVPYQIKFLQSLFETCDKQLYKDVVVRLLKYVEENSLPLNSLLIELPQLIRAELQICIAIVQIKTEIENNCLDEEAKRIALEFFLENKDIPFDSLCDNQYSSLNILFSNMFELNHSLQGIRLTEVIEEFERFSQHFSVEKRCSGELDKIIEFVASIYPPVIGFASDSVKDRLSKTVNFEQDQDV